MAQFFLSIPIRPTASPALRRGAPPCASGSFASGMDRRRAFYPPDEGALGIGSFWKGEMVFKNKVLFLEKTGWWEEKEIAKKGKGDRFMGCPDMFLERR